MKYWLLALFIISTSVIQASNYQVDITFLDPVQSELELLLADTTIADETRFVPKHQKLKAILLAVFLGHFGVHRIYLGTSPNVPVVYSLTLGGGLGLLPLVDIIAILRADNLDQFRNCDKVFMWQANKSTPPSQT